jgi:hypothetical protein
MANFERLEVDENEPESLLILVAGESVDRLGQIEVGDFVVA